MAKVSGVEFLANSVAGCFYVIFWIQLVGLFIERHAVAISLSVLAVTCGLEFLQLWQPDWLQAIRATLPGRALLGTTFSWMDFPYYFIGAFAGFLVLCRV